MQSCSGVEDNPRYAVDHPERAAVLDVVQKVLDAVGSADAESLHSAMLPEARMNGRLVEEYSKGFPEREEPMIERMWNPEVSIDGGIASVWTPYDFYRNGEFSHCGIDAFQLRKVDAEWKVVGLIWNSLQPPDCQMHPAGPPRQ
ncbi:MAG: hypothetical protein ABGX31_07135 [bacterium]|jgi:hypothetical protein